MSRSPNFEPLNLNNSVKHGFVNENTPLKPLSEFVLSVPQHVTSETTCHLEVATLPGQMAQMQA